MILFFEEDPNIAGIVYNRMKKSDRDNTIWATTAEEAIETLKKYFKQIDRIYLDYPRNKPVSTYMEPVSALEIIDFLYRTKIPILPCEVHIITWNHRVFQIASDLLSKKGYKVYSSPLGNSI